MKATAEWNASAYAKMWFKEKSKAGFCCTEFKFLFPISHFRFAHSQTNELTKGQIWGRNSWSWENHIQIQASNALWVKLCWKVVLGGFTKMIPSGPIFLNLNYFRKNIWRLSSVQFHFWYIFGTSWTQPKAAEAWRGVLVKSLFSTFFLGTT